MLCPRNLIPTIIYILSLLTWIAFAIYIRSLENQWDNGPGEWSLLLKYWWFWLLGLIIIYGGGRIVKIFHERDVHETAAVPEGPPRYGNGERRTRGEGGFTEMV